jgi:hypothetical protein
VAWGWDIKQYQQDALDFGIPADKLPEFVDWSQAAHHVEIGHPNVFYTLEAARRFIARFPEPKDVALVGIGLHRRWWTTSWRGARKSSTIRSRSFSTTRNPA